MTPLPIRFVFAPSKEQADLWRHHTAWSWPEADIAKAKRTAGDEKHRTGRMQGWKLYRISGQIEEVQ